MFSSYYDLYVLNLSKSYLIIKFFLNKKLFVKFNLNQEPIDIDSTLHHLLTNKLSVILEDHKSVDYSNTNVKLSYLIG